MNRDIIEAKREENTGESAPAMNGEESGAPLGETLVASEHVRAERSLPDDQAQLHHCGIIALIASSLSRSSCGAKHRSGDG